MTDLIDLTGKSVIVTKSAVNMGEESFDIPHGPEQPGLAQVG